MEPIARKSDGGRIFTPEFKRQQIERVLRDEVTHAELSRELQIARPLLARWKHLIASGAETAVAANEDVVPPRSSKPRNSGSASWSASSANRRSTSRSCAPRATR